MIREEKKEKLIGLVQTWWEQKQSELKTLIKEEMNSLGYAIKDDGNLDEMLVTVVEHVRNLKDTTNISEVKRLKEENANLKKEMVFLKEELFEEQKVATLSSLLESVPFSIRKKVCSVVGILKYNDITEFTTSVTKLREEFMSLYNDASNMAKNEILKEDTTSKLNLRESVFQKQGINLSENRKTVNSIIEDSEQEVSMNEGNDVSDSRDEIKKKYAGKL